jgi:signal recognition particle subunit SRP54
MALFEGLSEKLQNTIAKMRGKARVTEKDVKEMTREVKLALLEADVNFRVVKDFIKKVTEKALGQNVMESLTPGQQIVKVVHEELISMIGDKNSKITFSSQPPTIYLMAGLQGSGKTTTSGKLANLLRKEGKRPLLVACDVYRPAAIKQLQIVGKQLDISVYAEENNKNPVKIAKNAIKHAKSSGYDLIIIDTAGRLHIDDDMMTEILNIKKAVNPHEILLVVDSMTGQDAVNVADSFNKLLEIDGIILTKLDGDTRGGAALSTKAVTGKPVKFAGIGEKMNEFEVFHPERMASRILGMGDVLSLIEKAQEAYDEKAAVEMQKKMLSNQFTLEDFLDQMQQIKKMGSISQIVSMIPGMNSKMLKNIDTDDKKLVYIEAIIQSMTKKERQTPNILNASRKKRIAKGSGTSIQQVNKLLSDFEGMKKMMKNMDKLGKKGGLGMGGFGGGLPF